MPELPEVETLRRSLLPIVGRRVVAARLLRADFCTTESGRKAQPRDLLVDAEVGSLQRHGKQMAIVATDGRALVVHLGMSGQLRLLAGEPQRALPDHVHAHWAFDDGTRLLFRDPRRFGGLWTLATTEALQQRWSALGPDALALRPAALAAAARGSRRAIKALLLDQGAVAGIGNIYADESLFMAGIRPSQRADRLSRPNLDRLTSAIRSVLDRALKARGSTLRDYVAADGRAGEAQLRHAVYGRGGSKCVRCGTGLRSTQVAQRTTVYCPSCQR